jgi:hypothetical protein
MTPQEHKNAINAAMMRCCRAYGTSASGGAITGFEQHLDELVRMYTACLAHNEMQNAQIQLLKRDLEAIGAGGVDGRRITGEKS